MIISVTFLQSCTPCELIFWPISFMNLCFCFYCAISLRLSICALSVHQKPKGNELRKFAKNTSGNWSAALESCVSFPLRKRRDVNIVCVSLFTEISSYTWKSRTVGKNVSRAKLKLTEEDVWHQQQSNVHLSQALTLKMVLSKSIFFFFVFDMFTATIQLLHCL